MAIINQTKKIHFASLNYFNDNADLSIEHYAYEVGTPEKELVRADSSPTYRLHYIESGQIIFYVGENKTVLKKNTFFLLAPNEDTSYIPVPEDPGICYWITFTGSQAKTYLKLMGFLNDVHFIKLTNHHSAIINFFKKGLNNSIPEMSNVIFLKNFFSIVEVLFKQNSSFSSSITRPQNPYVEHTLDYINKHYSNPDLTIKTVAALFSIHEGSLSRILKKHLDTSFSFLLSKKRIQEAIILFTAGQTIVNEVALAVGFIDPYYISKVFKRFESCSPTEYIKQVKAKQSTK